jgi:hypothetical protein
VWIVGLGNGVIWAGGRCLLDGVEGSGMCVCKWEYWGVCGEFLNMFVEDLSEFGSIVYWMNRRG